MNSSAITSRSHVSPADRLRIHTDNLKALFFVKDLAGNPAYTERNAFTSASRPTGKRVRVEFEDGEVLVGTTMGYRPDRPGFFLEPADPASNNERCYVLAAATRDISFAEQALWEYHAAVGTKPAYA